MASYEIDSFVLKFKNLLLAGIQANLTIKSEAGQSVMNLSVEVDGSIQPSHQFPHHHRDGIARQCSRARREAARATAENAADAETLNFEEEHQVISDSAEDAAVEDSAEQQQEVTEKEKIII